MAEDDPVNPSLVFSTGDGVDVPLYFVSFDKHGACLAPRTRARVLEAAVSGGFTDIHIYSHGWNNVFEEAERHYADFFTAYCRMSRDAGLDAARYKPLIVGILWPSTALLAPGEETPQFAALDAAAPPTALDDAQAGAELAELTADMAPEAAEQLGALLSRRAPLTGADARMAADLLTPVLGAHAGGDDEGGGKAADADALLRAWSQSDAPARPGGGAPGRLPLPGAAPPDLGGAAPQAAGLLEFLNPRELLRKATVFMMKDRAAMVGRAGVADLVRDAVASGRRVHLTGHSYGARVVLSALAQLPAPARVTSVLLLQPAISAYCFAARLAEHGGRPGGYRAALDRVVLPLFTTFSPHDRALSSFYPLALRRGHDIGEVEPAGPASRHAALGGVGPQDMAPGEAARRPILAQPTPYDPLPAGVRVLALDGTHGITGHGDVRNVFTEWALANLVRMGAAP